MLTPTTPYRLALGNGLTMKSITDEHDAERINAFDVQIFGQNVEGFSRSLILNHPATCPEYWLYIEDDATGQIVSSLCLIPWQWRYEDVTLKSGEVGIVATLEAYRNRGLIRTLMARHRELLREGEFDLSHIQGIPYFYRQFGYEYALPLDAYWHIQLHAIPTAPGDIANQYSYRLATLDDIPVLMRLYEDATQGLQISALRDESVWQYLLQHAVGTDTEAETWLILDANQQPLGYWRISKHGFGEGMIVNETSRLNYRMAEVLLSWLKPMAVERNKPYIRLSLPASNDLISAARGFGATDGGTYAWQMHLVDVACLLRKLTPVLERRIAASYFAGMSRTVILNLYREAFELRFEQGKLLTVNSIGFTDKGEIRIPPQLLTPLLLGYRSREELREMYPDVSISGQYQYLVDVMFPKLDSFIYTIY